MISSIFCLPLLSLHFVTVSTSEKGKNIKISRNNSCCLSPPPPPQRISLSSARFPSVQFLLLSPLCSVPFLFLFLLWDKGVGGGFDSWSFVVRQARYTTTKEKKEEIRKQILFLLFCLWICSSTIGRHKQISAA